MKTIEDIENADARAMLDCAGQRKIEFDIMYNEFEAWEKTADAFKCVQASDFKEVWMMAYRAGMKAQRIAQIKVDILSAATPEPDTDRLMLLLAHAVKEADGWHDDSHGGQIEDDQLMDEARALVAGVPSAPTLGIYGFIGDECGAMSVRDAVAHIMKRKADVLEMFYQHEGKRINVELRILKAEDAP